MARYYFDSIVAGSTVENDEGKELSDFSSASHYALDALADIARHEFPQQGSSSIANSGRIEPGEVVMRAAVSVKEEVAAP